jgi:anti-sigma factor RsiW
MDCALIQEHLIGYHFAALSEEERQSVEAHLVACSACLREYLALKAEVDRGSRPAEGPSEAVRLKLRAAVEARFRPSAAKRFRRYLSRPVPLYKGIAIAALGAAAAAFAPALLHALHPETAHAAERVDTARPVAQSLTIY